jgi:lysophospholipase L1-like esterase
MRIAPSVAALRLAIVSGLAVAAITSPVLAEPPLHCGHFTRDVLAAPEPRENPFPVRRAAQINADIRSQPYRMLLLGDSLTERWDPALWRDHMARRGILNAGVSGDRTEHLIWRLDHGNLAGPAPQAVIVLIGTNDLGHGRSPDVAAEGIRAVLVKLRERLPNTRILLLGLLPREESPDARLRQQVNAVNRLIETCGDNQMIFYADIGGVLLDGQGRLSRAVAPDQLHFSAAGYSRLASVLDRLIDALPVSH